MPGSEAARQAACAAIPSGMSSYRSRGRLEVVPGGYDAAPGHDGSVPRAHLLWAAAFLLLEAIADDAPGDPDASVLTLVRDLGLAEPDRALFPALIRVALGPSEVKRSALAPGGPAWSGEPLTESETRVLRYLPTHLGASQIAAELCLSANTVKTHVRHLYLKLGVHSRREAVQRARAIGLLTGSPRWP